MCCMREWYKVDIADEKEERLIESVQEENSQRQVMDLFLIEGLGDLGYSTFKNRFRHSRSAWCPRLYLRY